MYKWGPYSPYDYILSNKTKWSRETNGLDLVVDFFGVGYLICTKEKSNQRLKCYGIEKESIWEKIKFHPLPIISQKCLV